MVIIFMKGEAKWHLREKKGRWIKRVNEKKNNNYIPEGQFLMEGGVRKRKSMIKNENRHKSYLYNKPEQKKENTGWGRKKK